VKHAGVVAVTVAPDSPGQQLLRTHDDVRVDLSITYHPAAGKPGTISFTNLLVGD
jgi:hypothetical protein